MTEGISKERLKELLTESSPNFIRTLKWLIHNECTELEPWLPIENAPKDIWVLVKDAAGDPYIGKFSSEYGKWYVDIGVHVIPTHYKLLPEDPK